MEEERSYSKFYVYHIESLSVNLREYRTIRMSEFYGMVDILLHPSPKQVSIKDSTENSKDDAMRLSRMDDFIQQNRSEFNHSQLEVLKSVMSMPEQ